MKKERRWYCVREIFRGGLTAAFMFGMNENEAVALVGRTETRVPEAIDALLHGEPERKKAVFAINTHTLFLVLRELEHRKVRIPDDLGVRLRCVRLVRAGLSGNFLNLPADASNGRSGRGKDH